MSTRRAHRGPCALLTSAGVCVAALVPCLIARVAGDRARVPRSSGATQDNAAPYFTLDESSDWEVVFRYSQDKCPAGGGPDSMPIAWYNRAASPPHASLIFATSHGINPLVGSDLSHLRPNCERVVFNSTMDSTPDSYANYQWLQNVRLLANGSAFGLVHNEFKPELSPPNQYCSCSVVFPVHNSSCVNHCEMWSTGLAMSVDHGETFRLAASPPNHLVATLPVEFKDNQPLAGYGAISPLLPGSDGYYYGLINVAGNSAGADVFPGNCPIRTNNLGDPTAYRGRASTGEYTVQWHSAYGNQPQGWGHCDTLPVDRNTWLAAHTTFREVVPGNAASIQAARAQKTVSGEASASATEDTLPTFMAFGDVSVEGGGVKYSWSRAQNFEDTFESWWTPTVLALTGVTRWVSSEKTDLLYPVLLDDESPAIGQAIGTPDALEQGDNFAIVGLNSTGLHVYIVTSGRNIIRHRLRVSSTPPVPQPPPPPPPAGCNAFRVTGAGNSAANGVYKETSVLIGDVPSFGMDATHQLYRVLMPATAKEQAGYVWHLGHYNVAGSVLYASATTPALLNQTLPPWDWRLAASDNATRLVAPAPKMVECTNLHD
eukprot:m.76502 g.76502  ORF g.76502 m.76502 type:complete len:601 (-) comp10535_c0_seq2:27-1829(-)